MTSEALTGATPGPHWGLHPQTPFRLALRALAMVCPYLPPLANPGSANGLLNSSL